MMGWLLFYWPTFGSGHFCGFSFCIMDIQNLTKNIWMHATSQQLKCWCLGGSYPKSGGTSWEKFWKWPKGFSTQGISKNVTGVFREKKMNLKIIKKYRDFHMESGSCTWRKIGHISGWLFRGRGSLAMVRRIDYDGTNGLMKTALLANSLIITFP